MRTGRATLPVGHRMRMPTVNMAIDEHGDRRDAVQLRD
ncbi:hypothetical protein GFS60_07606 (plasmid) [Rhodococcus sp. WAY2]|nr:hypothetical protein GFS60_07606 [Rhodococcus sp. WAY2]